MSNTILRNVVSGIEAKEQLLEGLNKSCDIISSTMGYRGSNILFETIGGLPHLTSDGYDSLQQLFWESPMNHIATEILKEASKKTYETVGDNTTLVCVLTQAFFKNSLEELKQGVSSIEIKNNIDKSVEKVLAYIDSISTPVTEQLMFDIAKTSAHGDGEIASIVQDAFVKAGEFGLVSHKRSFTDETYIEHIAGNALDAGYANEGFINVNDTQSCVFDNALVLCSLINFQTAGEVIPFLEYASEAGRPLVIVGNMEHDVSDLILTNAQKNKYPFCVIKPPYVGKKGRETMSDLALVLGCEVLQGITRTNYDGKEQLFLGTCDRIEIGKKDTVITPSKEISKDDAKGRITDLTAQIKLQDNEGEKNYLRERIAKINGGISTVVVGGITPSEVEEKVARVDDAICAVRASKDGGVVAGGGTALYHGMMALDLDIVTSKSLLSPISKIISNAGKSADDVWIGKMYKYPTGYDVKDYKIVNMFDAGILDTAKGVKNALINAASASNNLLRTNNAITLKRFAKDGV
jgi:chaperonin GroEL